MQGTYQRPLDHLSEVTPRYKTKGNVRGYLRHHNYAPAYNNRGSARAQRHALEAAAADFTQAIRLTPDYALAYYNRGNVLSYQGKSDDAVADFDRAIALNPNRADAYYNRGMTHYRATHFEKAITDFDRAIQLDQRYAKAYYNRGNARRQQGQLKAAADDFREAVWLNPQHVNGWINLCWWGSLAGMAAEIMDACDRAVALAPENDMFSRDSRGLARALTGNLSGALDDFAASIERAKPYNLWFAHF
jgi:tetratricopeptide (TPR) repeat protein